MDLNSDVIIDVPQVDNNFNVHTGESESERTEYEFEVLLKNKDVEIFHHEYFIIPKKTDQIITKIQYSIRIADENFDLNETKNGFVISHSKWSLIGEGKSILDAEFDLREQGKLIASEYINETPANLTEEAMKFREFLLKIIP